MEAAKVLAAYPVYFISGAMIFPAIMKVHYVNNKPTC
jgi:hypothetical protein